MPYTSIMVHMDNSQRAMHRLDIAATLAGRHGARLIALYAGFMPDPAWFYLMEGADRVIEEDRRRRNAQREAVYRQFCARMHAMQFKAEWRAVEGDPMWATLRECREADLIIAGQRDPDDADSYVSPEFVESLVLSCGRPVLVIPYAGQFDHIGTHSIVAWNGTAEAARALHDAAPLMAGGSATVFCAHDEQMPPRPDASPVVHAVAALRDHGVHVTVERSGLQSDLGIGECLLSRAADLGADLIVMGSYGRGRLRELVLGGVTQTLLSAMTVPVLMSH